MNGIPQTIEFHEFGSGSGITYVALPDKLMRCPNCRRAFALLMVDDSDPGEPMVYSLRQATCPYCGVKTEMSRIKKPE